MHRRSYFTVAAIVALAGAVLLAPANAHDGHNKTETASFDPYAPKKVSPETAMAIGFTTAEVDFGEVEDILRLTGIVRPVPDRVHAVAPRFAGIIRSMQVQLGDTVRTGDMLAEIESPDLAKNLVELRRAEAAFQKLLAEVKQSESDVLALEIAVPATGKNADLAEAESLRLEAGGEAVSANLLGQRRSEAIRQRADAALKAIALDQARVNVDSLRAQLQSTERLVGAIKSLLPSNDISTERASESGAPGMVKFYSPINGIVVSRNGMIGQGVEAGSAMLVISDLTNVQIEGEVPESLITRLTAAKNALVRIRNSNDAALIGEGTIRFISPVIDASKRTAHVIIDAVNAKSTMRQGQFVELAVVLDKNQTAVVIPISAVVKEGPLEFVLIKDGDYFKKHDIATGTRNDLVVEVKQGLAPGDVVVVGGAFSLSQLRGIVPDTASSADAPAQPADTQGHKH